MASGTLGCVLSPFPMSVRWEEEYTVRTQLQERVNELQEVRVATPLALLPVPPHTCSHMDITSPFPPGCRRPKRRMLVKRNSP